jgi:exodeoxyribonuclease VII small subunit
MSSDQMSQSYAEWEAIAKDGAFEEVLSALQAVVGRLEESQLRLDDSVRCYEIGTLLARRCERLLDEAELRITRLDSPANDIDD